MTSIPTSSPAPGCGPRDAASSQARDAAFPPAQSIAPAPERELSALIHGLLTESPPDVGAVCKALDTLLAGAMDAVQAGGLLAALAAVRPNAQVLAAGASVLRRHAVQVRSGVRPLVDTCGTGGDGSGSFNISTAAALTVVAAGLPVAKHGNRAVSSKVGSADVLAACGVCLDGDADTAVRRLSQTGFAFLFAPSFHPAMANVAPFRRRLGIRTLFNLLGPLANPASAEIQLLGVYSPELTQPMAAALRELGSQAALVVHCPLLGGAGGLDELGLHGPTHGHLLRDGDVVPFHFDPASLGLAPVPPDALTGGATADIAAGIMQDTLAGTPGPHRDAVALNAGAALWLAGQAEDLAGGFRRAMELLAEGAPLEVLRAYVQASGQPPAGTAGPGAAGPGAGGAGVTR